MKSPVKFITKKKTLAQVGRKVPSGIEKRGPTGLKCLETVLKTI